MDCQTATGTEYEPTQKQKHIRIDYHMDTTIEHRLIEKELVYHTDTLTNVDVADLKPDAEYIIAYRYNLSSCRIPFDHVHALLPVALNSNITNLQSTIPEHALNCSVLSPLHHSTHQSVDTALDRCEPRNCVTTVS